MEPTDPSLQSAAYAGRAAALNRRGLALFGVLILVVIFTLLGVGAITLAQRESRNSGSMIDIKSRQAAAYAGLVFALGEFQRDPVNFVKLLEDWRTKSVALYGTLTPPLPPVYLSFDTSGGPVSLTKTKPGPFPVPGSAYQIVVELAGVQVPPPSSAGAPVIMLRATGTGRSGDEQTVLGAYAVRNIRLNGGGGVALGITHPFYVNAGGSWNNRLVTSGGDVFMGGETHFNSTATQIDIKGGGLKVKGNLTWDNTVTISVDSSSWISGNMNVKNSNQLLFKKHLVVDGNVTWDNDADLAVNGTMLVRGTGGIIDIRGGALKVGSSSIVPSQLAVTKGILTTTTGGGKVTVTGDAYFQQLKSTNSKVMTLNVSKRLELSNNAPLTQMFFGNGTWGQFVARSLAGTSFVTADTGGISIGGSGTSWVQTPGNITMGSVGTRIQFGTSKIHRPGCGVGCPSGWYLFPHSTDSPVVVGVNPPGVSAAVNADGFDLVKPPATPADLGMTISPNTTKEVGFDLSKDSTVLASALVVPGGSALCGNGSSSSGRICGASLTKLRNDDIAAGSHHFHNGYFVVRIDQGVLGFDWDALPGVGGRPTTTPLAGKWLILVYADLAMEARVWPTTEPNADVNNPDNIQFIYVPPGSAGAITPSFQPRWNDPELSTSLTFSGYVRVEGLATTWNPSFDVNIRGAVHLLMDSTSSINMNSSAVLPSMTLDQAVLNSIGTAFGACFTNPLTGNPLAPPGPTGFVATENWIQFQPIGELR